MKTPKEIHISTKGVAKWKIDVLEELLCEEKMLNHRTEDDKINVFFIKNLYVALWLMYYLEHENWKWNEYYEE
jgi:hypothetical protein